MAAYYNEIDRFAAAWLRELIKAGVIADGEVDERSIEDVLPSELRKFTQCHFFAGIGVWSYALRSAGWPDDRPVWTGSCPCQPFSTAGKRKGSADERHLWPALFHLIEHGKPADVPLFGEQVASKDGLAWLDLVQADLEAKNHSFWPFDLCAAGFGAPHIRQRLYYVGTGNVADNHDKRFNTPSIARLYNTAHNTEPCGTAVFMADSEMRRHDLGGKHRNQCEWPESAAIRAGLCIEAVGDDTVCSVADTTSTGRQSGRGWSSQPGQSPEDVASYGETGKLADTGRAEDNQQGNAGSSEPRSDRTDNGIPSGSSGELRPATSKLADTGSPRPQGDGLQPILGGGQRLQSERSTSGSGTVGVVLADTIEQGREGRLPGWDNQGRKDQSGYAGCGSTVNSPTNGFWRDADWLWCRDEKFRPVEPGSFPLAHGSPNRVGRLRGYGNAIVAPQAEAFIRTYLEATRS